MHRPQVSLLLGSLLAAIGAAALLASPLPPVYPVFLLLAALAGGAAQQFRRRLLPSWLLNLLGVGCVVFSLIPHQRENLAQQSLIALTLLMGIKLLAQKKRRDYLQILALAVLLTGGAGSLEPELAFAPLILLLAMTGTFRTGADLVKENGGESVALESSSGVKRCFI